MFKAPAVGRTTYPNYVVSGRCTDSGVDLGGSPILVTDFDIPPLSTIPLSTYIKLPTEYSATGAGAIIYHNGRPVTKMFFIVFGSVRIAGGALIGLSTLAVEITGVTAYNVISGRVLVGDMKTLIETAYGIPGLAFYSPAYADANWTTRLITTYIGMMYGDSPTPVAGSGYAGPAYLSGEDIFNYPGP